MFKKKKKGDLPCGKDPRHTGYNSKGRTRASGWKLHGATLCFNTGIISPPFLNVQKQNWHILPGNILGPGECH